MRQFMLFVGEANIPSRIARAFETNVLSYAMPGCAFSTYDERTDMNSDSPATKHDLEELRSEVKQDLEQLRSEVNHVHDDLVERISDSETRLLQAFYSFADSNNKRLVQGEAATALVISRVTTLEDRVLQLEKRLNIPPS